MISDFSAREVSTGWWLFSGRVTVASTPVEGVVVTFGGDTVTLPGMTATTTSNGMFRLLVRMNLDGSDHGTATVVCTVDGLQSNVAMANVSP